MLYEKKLEDKAFQKLISLGYEEVIIKNREDLTKNFQNQFLKYNLDNQIDSNFTNINQLHKNWFDDLEYILFNDNKIKNVLDTFEPLREKHNVKMRDSKKGFLLELFNKKDWCKNLFQVARQVVMEDLQNNQNNARYDLVLFINGLPLVLIELKKQWQGLKEAFNQIKDYSSNFQSLFRYIEILIISDGNETEYFANQPQEKSNLLNRYRFQWTNFDYQYMNNLIVFIDDFLKPCRLAQIIARYIFSHEDKKSLLIMRPHQIHATETLLKLAEDTGNNGYIWHTTGSGKTFTSFALCDILQSTTNAQVFF
ncbi:hypothetical protein CWO85_02600 [Candidatus Phytoplasma ziziphi]|uniref:type I site-specific deoxyribonuclease n=1 Tax=Ziziphus jujuba witches'-broom phytoplasma TaxID=135727 RepID=A0A660HMW5_ZIZJU|nr:type I restriction endonuclease [Candidatus Phytoplasma ziziphi]AYJ01378.1 hypothetical protein CWO85_02600 [Candidatus Phytoplasma ziziphi]